MPRKPQVTQSKRWCFTWNNYPEDWKSHLNNPNIVEWCYGKEVGEEGTPHIQGYIECSKKTRPFNFRMPKGIHWEKTKGSRMENAEYCQKEGDFICSRALKPIRKIKTITDLRLWQTEIKDICDTEPDDRTIQWWWESTGAVGKSAMVRYMLTHYNAVMGAGKAADMKYSIAKYFEINERYPDIVIFDVPRDSLQYLSYTGIEEIKNGCFSSSKYESQTIVMPWPHVFIFANEEPQRYKMSADRWSVHHIASI